MRAVVQRVRNSRVKVEDRIVGEIGEGFLVLLGVEEADVQEDVKYLAEKICNLRVFEDQDEKMNLSLSDVNGELLVVSQFTLFGDCRKGRRPNFMQAARPDKANELYVSFVEECRKYVPRVETGEFQAMMDVELTNSGPVTLLLDSKKNF